MKRLILAVCAAGLAWGQGQNLITPVTILPNAAHTAPGQLRISTAAGTSFAGLTADANGFLWVAPGQGIRFGGGYGQAVISTGSNIESDAMQGSQQSATNCTFPPAWQSATTYGLGDVAQSGSPAVAYTSLAAGNLDHAQPVAPATSNAWWTWGCIDDRTRQDGFGFEGDFFRIKGKGATLGDYFDWTRYTVGGTALPLHQVQFVDSSFQTLLLVDETPGFASTAWNFTGVLKASQGFMAANGYGFYSPTATYNAFWAPNGGFAGVRTTVTDSMMAAPLGTGSPASACTTSGYGGLAYRSGSAWDYCNNATGTWGTVDFAAGSQWTLSSGYLSPAAGTGTKVGIGRTTDDLSGAILQLTGGGHSDTIWDAPIIRPHAAGVDWFSFYVPSAYNLTLTNSSSQTIWNYNGAAGYGQGTFTWTGYLTATQAPTFPGMSLTNTLNLGSAVHALWAVNTAQGQTSTGGVGNNGDATIVDNQGIEGNFFRIKSHLDYFDLTTWGTGTSPLAAHILQLRDSSNNDIWQYNASSASSWWLGTFDFAGGLRFGTGSLSSGGDVITNLDVGITRNSAGTLEVNNGTPGTFRDLSLRSMNAQAYWVSGSYQGQTWTITPTGGFSNSTGSCHTTLVFVAGLLVSCT